jgi:hypothetical protein
VLQHIEIYNDSRTRRPWFSLWPRVTHRVCILSKKRYCVCCFKMKESNCRDSLNKWCKLVVFTSAIRVIDFDIKETPFDRERFLFSRLTRKDVRIVGAEWSWECKTCKSLGNRCNWKKRRFYDYTFFVLMMMVMIEYMKKMMKCMNQPFILEGIDSFAWSTHLLDTRSTIYQIENHKWKQETRH